MTFNQNLPFRCAPLFAAVLLFLAAVVMTGCVSVQKSGNQENQPPAPSAEVFFDSRPANAEIYVNGKFRGTASLTLQLPAGTHGVEFRLTGFANWSRELVVVAGEDIRVTATLHTE